MDSRFARKEFLKCSRSIPYFVNSYVQIYDATARDWVSFSLWPQQRLSLELIATVAQLDILKARQLGLTWLCLGYGLWQTIFRPAATVLLFSRRDDEAIELLDFRLKGMYQRLPTWMQARRITTDAKSRFELSNGSRVLSFPTTGGRSYTATYVLVDEADWVPDLQGIIDAVKPTIDAGGQITLLSTVDKAKPESLFKNIYRESRSGLSKWKGLFLPWQAAPWRTQGWYDAERADKRKTTGSDDSMFQEYPETDAQALAPNSLDKRLSPEWVAQCYREMAPVASRNMPPIPGLNVYVEPYATKRYGLGIDPAEGNPTSDDSSIVVLDLDTAEECARLRGKIEPATLGSYANQIGTWYNGAVLLVERNNHGHAVILWLRDNSQLTVLPGRDGANGWQTTSASKALLYDDAASAFRDKKTTVHSLDCYTQLCSIEGATLRAPEGMLDDLAMAYVLALEIVYGNVIPTPWEGWQALQNWRG